MDTAILKGKKIFEKKKKFRPTDPTFFQHESGNKPFFLLGLIAKQNHPSLTLYNNRVLL